tara:strand:- start:2341 stop:2700 length:360 start_codon:yes stop_codon:yes gene_type:complete
MDNPMDGAVEIMKKGGTLLGEKCPRCGGVQMKYKGRVICIAEDNLSENLKTSKISDDTTLSNLRDIVIEKIDIVSNSLSKENDVSKQAILVDLLQKYVLLLKDCKNSNQNTKTSDKTTN